MAGQPIPADHGRPVPGAGSHPRTGGRRQCTSAASGALGPRKQLPAQDRPPPDPRLPAVRRPRVPGGALPRMSRRSRHAGARDAEMSLPGGHTTPHLRDDTPRDEAAARRRGRGGLGPRLPMAPRVCGLRPAVGRPAEKTTTTTTAAGDLVILLVKFCVLSLEGSVRRTNHSAVLSARRTNQGSPRSLGGAEATLRLEQPNKKSHSFPVRVPDRTGPLPALAPLLAVFVFCYWTNTIYIPYSYVF